VKRHVIWVAFVCGTIFLSVASPAICASSEELPLKSNKIEHSAPPTVQPAYVKTKTSYTVLESTEAGTPDHKMAHLAVLPWVKDGWRLLTHDRDMDKAMQVWKKGIDQLDSDEVLLFAGVYYLRNIALKQLYALDEKHN